MVDQLIRVAETRYASGSGLQQDVLHAQVELSKILEEKITLENKQRSLENKINELLNRASFTLVPPPKDLRFPELTLELETLKKQALKQNPWLRVRQAAVDQASVEIKLALKDYWPDMDFKLAYGQRDDSQTGQDRADFVSASVMIKVPLWLRERQDRKLAASRKNYEAKIKSYQNLIETLPHRVDSVFTDILRTQENYRLFSSALILQAGQWARSSLSAYRVDKVEFNTMINAQIRLLRFELKAKRYLFNIYKKRAELEEVLGGPSGPSATSAE
jgi:outer membrane protein TolC